jgi:class 3 adenylate cyclase
MQLLTEPIVHEHGGQVLKYEADNLLAVFDDAVQAVTAAVAMSDAVAASPDWCSCEPKLAVSIGIDWGPMLVLPGEDCFGDAVNIAFKLGEDVAGPAEVLITDRVRARLSDELPLQFRKQQLSVAGFDLTVHRVRGRGRELVPAAAEAAAASGAAT